MFDNASSFRTENLRFLYLVSDQFTQCEQKAFVALGIIVSKKRAKKAVFRNQFKRRMRALFQLYAPFLPAGCKVVVIACTPVANVSFSRLRAEVEQFVSYFR
mgnify:CR=1 FL=1